MDQGSSKDIFDPAQRGVQHASLRRSNERAVLTSIALAPGISNAEVSRRTGLAPQTASAIVSQFEQTGIVRRGEVLRGRRGQPATPLFVNAAAAISIGCEIGWRHMEITLIDLGGSVIDIYRRDYLYPDAVTTVSEVSQVIGAMLGRLSPEQRSRVFSLGLASPTEISSNIHLLGGSHDQAKLWQDMDLPLALEDELSLPVRWFNDGNAACWAERIGQTKPRPDNMVHLQVGTFLGAGLVAGGTLWEGPTGNSADLGAMLVSDRHGKLQYAHFIASINALELRLKAAGITVPAANPLYWPWASWPEVVDDWIVDAGSALAQVIVNTTAVIETDLATIDGGMPEAIVVRLVDATRAALAALPPNAFALPRIARGTLGGNAVARGAAQLPMFQRFFSRHNDHMDDA